MARVPYGNISLYGSAAEQDASPFYCQQSQMKSPQGLTAEGSSSTQQHVCRPAQSVVCVLGSLLMYPSSCVGNKSSPAIVAHR